MSAITPLPVGIDPRSVLDREAGAFPAELALGTVVSSMYQHMVSTRSKHFYLMVVWSWKVSGLMLKLLAMACVTHMLSKTCNKHASTHMGPYPYYRTQCGHIGYCVLPDPGTQAPKTSNFVDGAAATSPTTNERGVVRVHERRGYLQRSSLWCEVEVKRNGEGESVTLMMVAQMMCRAKERREREGGADENAP